METGEPFNETPSLRLPPVPKLLGGRPDAILMRLRCRLVPPDPSVCRGTLRLPDSQDQFDQFLGRLLWRHRAVLPRRIRLRPISPQWNVAVQDAAVRAQSRTF